MKNIKSELTVLLKTIIAAAIFPVVISVVSCASTSGTTEKMSADKNKGEEKITLYRKNGKDSFNTSNLISASIFCADPTSVEYNGRLYVYGTNDHQQYLNSDKNTYEFIKSIVIFSTDDMVNWTYHGYINVEKVAPWIINSWAPSICSRVEEDGLTHFYLYFSNNGCGTGVITATDPLGPWTDPLGKPLVSAGMKGLDSPNPFDPGVVIDSDGTGWLALGGGIVRGGDEANPCSSKIVKLGKDMISLDSRFTDTYAPYFFEASELNYINGTYIYTFNHSWGKNPGMCSMGYMTSRTPLRSSSWEYQGYYFRNPGEMGFDYSNNHTHLQKYQGKYYIFYHTLSLQRNLGITSGMRSICVGYIDVDEESAVIRNCQAVTNGVNALKNVNPFESVSGTECFTCAGIGYESQENPAEVAVLSQKKGAWVQVKNVDFSLKADKINILCKGAGRIEVRLDNIKAPAAAVLYPAEDYTEVQSSFNNVVYGTHDVYFIFSDENMGFSNWNCSFSD